MARPKKHDGVLYRRGRFWWMRYWDRDGTRRLDPQRQVTGRKPKHGYVNDCRHAMRTCSRWFGEANNSGFTSGRTFSWSTIPSRPCGV